MCNVLLSVYDVSLFQVRKSQAVRELPTGLWCTIVQFFIASNYAVLTCIVLATMVSMLQSDSYFLQSCTCSRIELSDIRGQLAINLDLIFTSHTLAVLFSSSQ